MANKSAVSREELIMRFGADIKIPPYEKLIRKHITAKIGRAMASARDEYGRRRFLAKRNGGKTEFINVDKCTDVSALKDIKNRFMKDIIGREKTLDNINLQLRHIRQLSLSDFPGGDAA